MGLDQLTPAMIRPPKPNLDVFLTLLEKIRRRFSQLNRPLWTVLLRGIFLFATALAVAYAANWLLNYFHLDPFGIREIEW